MFSAATPGAQFSGILHGLIQDLLQNPTADEKELLATAMALVSRPGQLVAGHANYQRMSKAVQTLFAKLVTSLAQGYYVVGTRDDYRQVTSEQLSTLQAFTKTRLTQAVAKVFGGRVQAGDMFTTLATLMVDPANPELMQQVLAWAAGTIGAENVLAVITWCKQQQPKTDAAVRTLFKKMLAVMPSENSVRALSLLDESPLFMQPQLVGGCPEGGLQKLWQDWYAGFRNIGWNILCLILLIVGVVLFVFWNKAVGQDRATCRRAEGYAGAEANWINQHSLPPFNGTATNVTAQQVFDALGGCEGIVELFTHNGTNGTHIGSLHSDAELGGLLGGAIAVIVALVLFFFCGYVVMGRRQVTPVDTEEGSGERTALLGGAASTSTSTPARARAQSSGSGGLAFASGADGVAEA